MMKPLLILGLLMWTLSCCLPVAAQNVGETPSPQAVELGAEEREAISNLLIKAARLSLSGTLGHLELLGSEIKTYPTVREAFLKAVGNRPDSAELKAALAETDTLIDLQSAALLAESGSLEDFAARMAALKGLEAFPQDVAIIYLGAFRAARLRGDVELSRKYLQLARDLSTNSAETRPVLEYALRTAEQQMRRLQGHHPDNAEWSTDYRHAWAALDNYKPFKVSGQDDDWYEGRMASRYWIEELANSPNLGLLTSSMLVRFDEWSDSLKGQGVAAQEMSDFLVFLDVALAQVDQMTFLLHEVDRVAQLGDLGPILDQMESVLTELAALPEKGGLTLSGPGFPAFDVTTGGLIPELVARVESLRR